MTIDEAINYYNTLADDIDKNPLPGDSSFEPRQIADWLEELKAIKEGVVFYSNKPIEEIIFEARNNAIDEYTDLLIRKCYAKFSSLEYVTEEEIREIVKKLKEQK